MENLSSTLIYFSRNTALEDVPESALHILKLSLLDWFAVAIAGTQEPASRTALQMLNAEAGTPETTVIGQSTRLPARAAALANGITSHALDYDDTHFLHIGHPSVTVFPAALAMAERQNATGAGFLIAALTGYEASCRIGHWLGRSHYEAGFHMTATAGTFGATLAASRLLGLNETQTSHALGLAATQASGLKVQFGSMGKPYNAGKAAANGIEATLLAGLGFTSSPDALSGFAQSHAGEMRPLETVLDGLGARFVLEQVQHKFHACCHGLHATLEALGYLFHEQNPSFNLFEKLDIQTHPRWLKVCNKKNPKTGLEAKFSYRHTAAMALLGINTGALNSFNDTLCTDPKIIALREKISVSGNPELPDTGASIRLTCTGQSPFISSFDLATSLPAKERETRVLHKAKTLLGLDQAHILWQEIHHLEQEKTLSKLLQAGTQSG